MMLENVALLQYLAGWPRPASAVGLERIGKPISRPVNRNRFIEKILLAGFFISAKFSPLEWSGFRGADLQVRC
ncbi:MAG: hypothetical protein ACLP2P_16840 [Desulfobaccales bacterium]